MGYMRIHLDIGGGFGQPDDAWYAVHKALCAELCQSNRQHSMEVASQQVVLHALTCNGTNMHIRHQNPHHNGSIMSPSTRDWWVASLKVFRSGCSSLF